MYRQPGVKVGSMNEILGTRVKIKYPHRVDFNTGLTNGKIDDIKKWCDDNCKGIWNLHTAWACYIQFTDERDALLFALRWGVG